MPPSPFLRLTFAPCDFTVLPPTITPSFLAGFLSCFVPAPSTPLAFKENPAASAEEANGTASPIVGLGHDVPKARPVFAAAEVDHSRAIAERVVVGAPPAEIGDRVEPARQQQQTEVLPPISSLTSHQEDDPGGLRSLLSRHHRGASGDDDCLPDIEVHHSPVRTTSKPISALSPVAARAPASPAAAVAVVARVEPAVTLDEENGHITVDGSGRDGPQDPCPQASPRTPEASAGYGQGQAFPGHSSPAAATYDHPGYHPAATVNDEGAIWTGSPGHGHPHQGFSAYNGAATAVSSAAGYGGYPYSSSQGYAQTTHAAAPVLTGSEGYAGHGGHAHPAVATPAVAAVAVAAAQRGQSPVAARTPGGSGYASGGSAPVGGMQGYGWNGAHPALFRGQGSRSSSKESPESARSSSGELCPSREALAQGGGSALGFEEDGGRGGGHLGSAVGRDGDRHQKQHHQQQQMSTNPRGPSPRRSSLRKTSPDGNSSQPSSPGYAPSAVRSMQHARHSYAHNAHMDPHAAAVQGAPATGVGVAGGVNVERHVYNNHHHPTGALYVHDSRMSHDQQQQQQQYQRGDGLQVEARSPTAGGGGGVGVEAVSSPQQQQQQVQGLGYAAQHEVYDQYRMTARFESHAQAQQHTGGAMEGHGSLGQASGAAVPSSNLGSSAAIPEQGW